MKYLIAFCLLSIVLSGSVNSLYAQKRQNVSDYRNPLSAPQAWGVSKLVTSRFNGGIELFNQKRLIDSLRNAFLISPQAGCCIKNAVLKNYGVTQGLPSPPNVPYKSLLNNTPFYPIDTVIFYDPAKAERYSYLYDLNGNIIRDIIAQWSNGEWTNFANDTMTYVANHLKLSDIYKRWSNGKWTNSELYTYTYDAAGHELSLIVDIWNNNRGTYFVGYIYTYDANGDELSQLYEYWADSVMVLSDCYIYTYDASGHNLTKVYEIWNNGRWTKITSDTYTYDTSGNELTDLLEFWSGDQVTASFRDTYTYDVRGDKLSDFEEQWNNGLWTNYWIFTFTYDAQGNELSELSLYWTGDQWTNKDSTIYTYDANGHELTELNEMWSNDQWTNSDLYTYTYNESGHELSWIYKYWSDGQWANADRSMYTYDANENLVSFSSAVWVVSVWTPSPGVVQISNGVNGIESYEADSISIIYRHANIPCEQISVPSIFILFQNYPNPFNATTTINYDVLRQTIVNIKVYDILGREVATLVNETESTGNYTATFNAINLASGVYFYRLQAGAFTQTKKMLVLK